MRVRAAGFDLEMHSGAGTFARNGLDAGSLLLVETFLKYFDGAADAHLCDLGCGWGAVGCLLASARSQAPIFACDINGRAVALARDNARRLNLQNVAVCHSDGLQAVRSKYFDAVLSNPPVRAGNRVIERLFDDAHRCLRDDGELWVVLRTAQGAKSWQKRLSAQFGGCDAVALEGGYRVLRCAR